MVCATNSLKEFNVIIGLTPRGTEARNIYYQWRCSPSSRSDSFGGPAFDAAVFDKRTFDN